MNIPTPPNIIIDQNSELFKTLSSSTLLDINNREYTPDKRHITLNSIMYVAVIIFNLDQSPESLKRSIISKTVENIDTIIFCFTEVMMMINKYPIEHLNMDKFNQSRAQLNLQNMFLSNLESGQPILEDAVKKYCFAVPSGNIPFEEFLIIPNLSSPQQVSPQQVSPQQNSLPSVPVPADEEPQIVDETILKMDSNIGERYSLKRLLSKKEDVEVWVAKDTKFGNNEKVLKLINADSLKWFNRDKPKISIDENFTEYTNLKHLKAYEKYITSYPYADFSKKTNRVYLVSDLFTPLRLDAVASKPDLLIQLFYALDELHKLGYCYNNLKPDHIMFDKHGQLKLIDFKRIKPVGEQVDIPASAYNSASLNNHGISSIYNDFESLIYIWETLITSKELSFGTYEEEKDVKNTLQPFDAKTKHAILELRKLQQGGHSQSDDPDQPQINYPLNKLGENTDVSFIYNIFIELISGYDEVPPVLDEDIQPHVRKATKGIKMNMVTSGLFDSLSPAEFDTMAVCIAFYTMDMTPYDPVRQQLIDRFLNTE